MKILVFVGGRRPHGGTCFGTANSCAASLGKICASDRTVNAIDGMSALTHDFDTFTDARGAEYPTWREPEKEAGKYLR